MFKKTLTIVLFVFIFSCFFVRTTQAYVFDTDLSVGTRGDAVTELQQVLKNLNFFTYPTITNFFGSATKQAVELFQSSKGIATESTKGYGRVGPATRDALNAVAPTNAPAGTSTSGFVRDLERGMTGSDVEMLQQFLNTHGFPVAPTGPGSLGHETKLFQKATRAALQQFQSANGILPVNGRFGPLTRAKVNSLLTANPTVIPVVSTLAPVIAPILSATSAQNTQIALSWTKVSDATAYRLQRKESTETSYTTIAQAIVGQTYTDTNVQNYKIYSYTITALTPIGESPESNILTATTGLLGGGGGSSAPATDTTAPVMSTITSTPSSVTADIAWTTDENGTSHIEYGLTTSYGSTDDDATFTTSHMRTLSGLSSNTTYHYTVSSTDAAGNTSTSSDNTFTTTFSIAGLPHWSTAINGVLAGTQNARVVFIGDSTTAGYDPSNGFDSGNNKAESTPTVVASLFPDNLGGITSFTGNQNATDSSLYDTRASFGANWSFSQTNPGQVLGGYALETQAQNTPFTFAPGKSWDTAELYYSSYQNGISADVSANGTDSLGTLDLLSNSLEFNKSVFTKTLGTDTLATKMTAGNQYDLEGVVTYNSAVKEITVLNAGWSGATAEDVAGGTSPWSTVNGLSTYDPDLVVIDLGVNDWNQSTPTDETTFKNSMQSIIDAAKNAGSDVLLVVPVPSGTGNGIANEGGFQTYIHDLATTNNVPVVDMISQWGSYASANRNGWMSDQLHPNIIGYAQKAQSIFSAIWQ